MPESTGPSCRTGLLGLTVDPAAWPEAPEEGPAIPAVPGAVDASVVEGSRWPRCSMVRLETQSTSQRPERRETSGRGERLLERATEQLSRGLRVRRETRTQGRISPGGHYHPRFDNRRRITPAQRRALCCCALACISSHVSSSRARTGGRRVTFAARFPAGGMSPMPFAL